MRSPAQIRQFLDENLWRFDLGTQYLGDEPNVVFKDWDACSVRTLMVASWAYEQAAGNQSIPAVYKAINIAREDFLCDRFYLPATPRDMRLLEKNGIPVFGIEYKHAMTDFDVVSTSISYPVLAMSFVKMLSMSGVPVRWRERGGTDPFVLVGGQAYAAPEVLAPVVDAFYLGEAEDEQGNPGIGRVMERISQYKQEGRWSTDRVGCYEAMAREFPYLYFPRFVEVIYDYQDRSHVGLEKPSKQVVGYRSLLEGMRMPFERHYVRDLDAIPPLDDAPLLYTDAGNASGDIEVARGCPAWCSFPLAGDEEFITSEGVQQIQNVVGQTFEVWTPNGWDKAVVQDHGIQDTQEIVFVPGVVRSKTGRGKCSASRPTHSVTVTATPEHGWQLRDGSVTHSLQVGDVVPMGAVTEHNTESRDYHEGMIHGLVFADGSKASLPHKTGYRIRLHGHKAQHVGFFENAMGWDARHLRVVSVTYPDYTKGDPNIWIKSPGVLLKDFPPAGVSTDYLGGFLAGWMAGDATPKYNSRGGERVVTSYCLASQDPRAGQWLQQHAAAAGWVLIGRYEWLSRETNFGDRSAPLVGYTLCRPSENRGWVVQSITSSSPQRVFCLEVPETHRFTLAGGVTTSNCRLSWVTKPYRQRSVDYMVEFGKNLKRNMGGTHVAYVAPDFPMHTEKKRLTKALVENVTDEVDGAAMRIDDFIADDQFVTLSSYAGMDGVTLGLEGNCLSGSTLVRVPGLGIVPMRDVESLRPKQAHSGDHVVDVEDAYCSGIRSLSRVSLSDGTQLLATPEHLIRVVDGQPASERVYLTPKQRKARGITSNYLSKRGQLDDLPEAWHEVQDLRPGMYVKTYYGQMQWPTEYWPGLTEDVAWLLGVLSGDGRVEESGVEVRCDDPGVLDRVVRVLSELGYPFRVKETGRAPMVTCYSRDFVKFLAVFGVTSTETKRKVPMQVMRSPRSVVAAYVSGVIDADGCVPERVVRHGVHIVVGSHVEQFMQDVAELVRALGHPTSLRKNIDARSGGYEMWHLTIRDARDADWSWVNLAETSRRQKLADAQSRALISRNTPQSSGGVAYARVVSVDPGVSTERVFDLTVPGSNSFTANGVVVHNSQRMRDLVGKGVSDEETREAVRKALEAGVRKVKLFMISNMPGEDEGDIERIVQLARDLAEIRDSMGKSNVVIQFSWTPLLIEANTPFQWFAPTPANYHLSHMWDAMRDLRIDFKIGSKSEVNKVTFFQLCQRASREIGEVLVDTMLELNVACWGGVPKSTRDLLDANMVKHGFLNGLEDAFDERGKDDLFGWEFISTGVSQSLLWDVYQQMVEFLEITDSTTYDEQFEGSEYHGAEWLSRCDERCLGKACGACTREDLEIRKQYTAADDESIDLSTVDAIDERSVAVKVRARLDKSEAYRLVTNDHWRFTLRRALYRAQEATDLPANIVKRSIVFASDAIGFKDWTHGTDYVEFALTKPVSSQALEKFLAAVEEELVSPTGQPWMQVGLWKIHPPTAGSIRADLDLTLYEVEVEEELSTLQARLRWWDEQESVDMTIRAPVTYFGPTMETVNAKEYVDGLWLAREGHRVVVRMLVRGRPSPYNVLAAFLGNPSWLEYARFPARRVDSFVQWETDQWDFFFPACQQCGVTIPVNVLEESFDTAHCPRCKDESEGRLIPV